MHFQSGIDIKDVKLTHIRQKFNTFKIIDIESEVYKELDDIKAKTVIKPGMKIAVTAGSRGIANIDLIIITVCKYLKEAGADPFIIPSMGSHGGATAEGQVKVLAKLGITEESAGVPIVSDMDVIKIGQTSNHSPVYMDKNAYGAEGIVIVNRVKPHTDFSADTESGLMKMIAVGLGKAMGCNAMHSYGLSATIPEAAKIAIESTPILMGLAIVENSKDETYKLKAIMPKDFEIVEKGLLLEAKSNVPKLPSDFYNVLVIKEMGKMYSGTGMDTKVVGRMKIQGEAEPKKPLINKIAVLDIAKSSYGNALGIGLADITTKKLVDAIDFDATYANTIATTFLERANIPVTMKDDQEAIQVALSTIGDVNVTKLKMAVIKNTLQLEELYVTEEVLKDIDSSKIEILSSDINLSFDEKGNLKL